MALTTVMYRRYVVIGFCAFASAPLIAPVIAPILLSRVYFQISTVLNIHLKVQMCCTAVTLPIQIKAILELVHCQSHSNVQIVCRYRVLRFCLCPTNCPSNCSNIAFSSIFSNINRAEYLFKSTNVLYSSNTNNTTNIEAILEQLVGQRPKRNTL